MPLLLVRALLGVPQQFTRFRCATRDHPRAVAGAFATLLLGVVSATMLVSDVGTAFGSTIPVMSGIQRLNYVDRINGGSTPGVSAETDVIARTCLNLSD